MRMRIDGENCSGHGRCAKYAPDVYRLDDDGYNADRGSEIDVPAGQEKTAILGMKSCPERAITLVED
jgi:ferredoxin